MAFPGRLLLQGMRFSTFIKHRQPSKFLVKSSVTYFHIYNLFCNSSICLKLCLLAIQVLPCLPNQQTIQPFCSKPNDDEGNLVYGGNLTRNLKLVKYFSLSTSALGLALQPYIVVALYDKSSALVIGTCSVIAFMTFLTPLLVHKLSMRYITHVYFNDRTKVFTVHTLSFFNRKTSVSFTAQDVTIPDISGAFSNIKVKGLPYFVVPEDFVDITAYEHMVGYDKPIDFSFESDDKEEKEKT